MSTDNLSSCSQSEIQDVFSQVGPVQSVIINKEKRHAFVKMLTRDYAVEAKRAMSEYKAGGLALRVSTSLPTSLERPTNRCRHAGVLASAPETAATTSTASA